VSRSNVSAPGSGRSATSEDGSCSTCPGLPLPAPGTPAPPRFLPDYDNVLLAHADRARILPAPAGTSAIGRPTVLVDGFVGATWELEREDGSARLVVRPFARLRRAERDAMIDEGRSLLSFLAPDAPRREVSITAPVARTG
jgi:hypothetical protein